MPDINPVNTQVAPSPSTNTIQPSEFDTERSNILVWKNNLKAIIKDIDENIAFVKKMDSNSEDYEGYGTYENLKTIENNFRTFAQNAKQLKDTSFENSEDNELKGEIVTDISFGCNLYARACQLLADNMQTTDYGRIHSTLARMKWNTDNANGSFSEALFDLGRLLKKYKLKY